MMMTHSYYGGDFDGFSRSNHRAPTAAHYDRAVPYHGWSEQQLNHDYRQEYVGRAGDLPARTLIQETSPERGTSANARRRIQVACARCRRRKIKCTGDPGDGSGCSACRSAGADQQSCVFNRVGSQPLNMPGVDVLSAANSNVATATPTAATYGHETSQSTYEPGAYQTHHRPSLPLLHTRPSYPEYDSYNTSPAEDYTYAASMLSRQQSFSSNYGAENFRTYTNNHVTVPTTTGGMYYEPGAAFSFGTLQAAGPFPSTMTGRLPSVTTETVSPLNMGSLHSSLPAQTAQERRLPVPYTQPYQQANYAAVEVPQIRPLGSFSEPQSRPHITGIHTRSGMPWSPDNTHGTASSRADSMSSLPSIQQYALPLSSGNSSSSLMSEPILGYQFSVTTGSPEASPTTGPTLSESFSSTSGSSAESTMLPPSTNNIRYSSGSSHHGHPIFGDTDEQPPRPSSSREAAASLYSFSAGIDTSERANSDRHAGPSSTDDAQLQLSATPQRSYPPIRHPQPQHASSVDELRRRSSYDHQRAATAHRMSVSNLNARY